MPVITFLPDEHVKRLCRLVKKRGTYSEVLWPDTVRTRMWMEGKNLMSQMEGEDFIKQILPNSQMDDVMAGDRFIGESGFSKSVQYIKERDNLPLGLASRIMLEIYMRHNIPKHVAIPREVLDTLEIGTLDEKTNTLAPLKEQFEDLESNTSQKEQ